MELTAEARLLKLLQVVFMVTMMVTQTHGEYKSDMFSHLYSFDPIEGLETLTKTNATVYHIEIDKKSPGTYIFSEGRMLRTLSADGKKMTDIATSKGNITSFFQDSNNEIVFVSDVPPYIQELNRQSKKNSSYEEKCNVTRPKTILGFKEKGELIIYVTSGSNNGSIVKCHDHRATVLISNLGHLPGGMTRDESNGDLLITLSHAVFRIHDSNGTWTKHLVAGDLNEPGFKDGAFCESLFNNPTGLTFIDIINPNTMKLESRQLYVSDTNNHRVRKLDFQEKKTSSICNGVKGHENGHLDRCHLEYPNVIFSRTLHLKDERYSYDPHLLIGEYKGIRKVGKNAQGLVITYAVFGGLLSIASVVIIWQKNVRRCCIKVKCSCRYKSLLIDEDDWLEGLEDIERDEIKRIRSLSISDCTVSFSMQIGEGHFAKIYIGEISEPTKCVRGYANDVDLCDESEDNYSDMEVKINMDDVSDSSIPASRRRTRTISTDSSTTLCCQPVTTKVAAKFLKDSLSSIDEHIMHFLAEASLMSSFNHLNVLGIIGVTFPNDPATLSSPHPTSPMIILPFMSNGDLKRFISQRDITLTIGDLLSLAKQVASGMQYLAESSFVHRDLAARNCLVSEDFVVKIGDFGMARDVYKEGFYKLDTHSSVPLPVKWMAIESLKEGMFTSQSDVWSYGVLLWELITRGAEPYSDVNPWEVKKYLEDGNRLAAPSSTPPNICQLMEQCWVDDPLERPLFSEILQYLDQTLKDYTPFTVKTKL